MKKLTTLKIYAIIIFLFAGIALNAQDKSEFKSKVDQLKGKVDKVTVNVDGKDVVFEGKDAEKLVKIIKPMAGKKTIMLSSEGDQFDMDVPHGNAMMFHITDDVDDQKGESKKKIQVEIKDGKKEVTVTTTNKDGKEEVKKLEGEEADKYIKEHETEGGVRKHVKIIKEGGDDDENVLFFNHRMAPMHNGGCSCCCGGGMQMMKMPGMGKHKIMMKMMDGEDDEDVFIEKKIKKEHEMKSEKNSVKKEEKK